MPSCSRACPGVLKSQIAGRIPTDSKAIETLIPVNLGSKGYDGASAAADRQRAISRADAGGLASHIAGPLCNAADSASAFGRISGTLLGATLGVVIVLLLSRGLWAHRRPHRPRPGRTPRSAALNLDLGRRVWWPSALARDPAPEPGQLKGPRSPVP